MKIAILLRKIKNNLGAVNWKTVYINFKCFPLKEALKFPILVSRKTRLKLSGGIEIVGNITTGMIKIGFGEIGIFDKRLQSNILEINNITKNGGGKMVFCGYANIGPGSKISIGNGGVLRLGNNFTINGESSIVCYKKITFGKDCLISWDCLFMDTDLHKILDTNNVVINEPKEIHIGDNVWFGCRCLILKGAKIKDGSIVGANSTVASELENGNSVYAGNPIKMHKQNVMWIR